MPPDLFRWFVQAYFCDVPIVMLIILALVSTRFRKEIERPFSLTARRLRYYQNLKPMVIMQEPDIDGWYMDEPDTHCEGIRSLTPGDINTSAASLYRQEWWKEPLQSPLAVDMYLARDTFRWRHASVSVARWMITQLHTPFWSHWYTAATEGGHVHLLEWFCSDECAKFGGHISAPQFQYLAKYLTNQNPRAIVEWELKRSSALSTVMAAAATGSTRVRFPLRYFKYVVRYAESEELFRWLFENNYIKLPSMVKDNDKNNNDESSSDAKELDPDEDIFVLNKNLGYSGSVSLAKLLVRHGIPIYSEALGTALESGSIHLVKFLLETFKRNLTFSPSSERPCQVIRSVIYEKLVTCSYNGKNIAELLHYLYENGYLTELPKNACTLAAQAGNLEMLKFFRTKQCPWDECLSEAIIFGHSSIAQWCVENGCPRDLDLCCIFEQESPVPLSGALWVQSHYPKEFAELVRAEKEIFTFSLQDICRRDGAIQYLKLLRQHGIEPPARTLYDAVCSATERALDVVRYLVEECNFHLPVFHELCIQQNIHQYICEAQKPGFRFGLTIASVSSNEGK